MTIRIFFLGVIIISHYTVKSQKMQALEIKTTNNAVTIAYGGKPRLTGGLPAFQKNAFVATAMVQKGDSFDVISSDKKVHVKFLRTASPNVVGIYLDPGNLTLNKGDEFSGFFFSQLPDYKQGVASWRYKPWNSWTKPVKVLTPSQLESWDNQFYYWQYGDGMYGAAIPLVGNGYRATLGSERGAFGSKAFSYLDGYQREKIPLMAIALGNDPYQLFEELFESALELMNSKENLRKNKSFPEPLEYLGWCTWNASSLGKNLNEETVLNGAETFTKNNFPLGWVLIDDGWFDNQNSRLRSMTPNISKFPGGFKPMIEKLKRIHGVKHIGVWHAFNGYWNGIDPASPLGEQYRNEMFSWRQKERVDVEDSPIVTYHFIKPHSDSLKTFYNKWHKYFKEQGFTFIKVDNQLVVERMSPGNFPISEMANAMHNAINESVKKYFNNAIINCMDMTSDAYFNFGSTPVARSVEDYFPYEEGEDYNLQRGNAAAHVLQGAYNNLYFSQMVFPDMDMFQSHNPNAEFHAIARAINNGPIYVTDNAGQQHFDILRKLVYEDGRIIRADLPLQPTEDCLFQVQDKSLFKGFSQANGIGLLGVWNCADADEVAGTVSASDVHGLRGDKFAVYESISKALTITDMKSRLPVTLKRLGYQLYYIAPLNNGVSPLGLLDKYNAPSTLSAYEITKSQLQVSVKGSGVFGAVLPHKPSSILVDGVMQKNFSYEGGLLKFNVQKGQGKDVVNVLIKL